MRYVREWFLFIIVFATIVYVCMCIGGQIWYSTNSPINGLLFVAESHGKDAQRYLKNIYRDKPITIDVSWSLGKEIYDGVYEYHVNVINDNWKGKWYEGDSINSDCGCVRYNVNTKQIYIDLISEDIIKDSFINLKDLDDKKTVN